MLSALGKGGRIVIRRLQTQGWRTTALWAYARGIPYITGVPLLRYSRVAPALYVGPQYRARGKRTLARAGITHIVNMRSEFDDAANGLTLQDAPGGYCHLPTTDDRAPTTAHLAQGAAFIREAIGGGGKVYIHCLGGRGQSAHYGGRLSHRAGLCYGRRAGSHTQGAPVHLPDAAADASLAPAIRREGNRSNAG